jgi:predicted phage baseplate assembly protein
VFAAQTLVSDGQAGQELTIADGAVVTEATQVTVTASGTAHQWTVALGWDRVGPDDPVAVLDPARGELRFGNGRTGRVPPAGADIDVVSRRGGGDAGNVDAGSLDRFVAGSGDPALSLKQAFAAWGGGPGETLADLQGQLLDRLEHPARAVSALDIEQLALETPGVPVGRVRVLPQYHPALPGLPAAGCVTVVVIPDCHGPRPEPTAGMLAAVRRFLSRRRPLTVELFVIGPTYTTITVHAQLQAIPGASGIAAAASARVDDFFHPLTGGPEGKGWIAGRDVYRAEILALLQGTPGVARVDALTLVAGIGDSAVSYCGNLPICPSSLIASGAHALTSTELARTR